MNGTLEQIEAKIAYLEQANAELSDVVYRQQRELDALRMLLTELAARMAPADGSEPTAYTQEEEKPPHY